MRLIYAIIAAVLVLLLFGCNRYELESDWRDREIEIDGDDGEWDESRFIIEKEKIVAGILNDEEFLYICIYPTEREMTQKIMRQGLTVWFNTENKRKKNYGIRFPLQTSMDKNKSDFNNSRQSGIDNDFTTQISKELEIIGPGKNQYGRYGIHELSGLKLDMKINQGILVYEIKIPYRYDPAYSFALDADPGSEILVGFEIEKMDLNDSGMKLETGEFSRGKSGGMPGGGKGSGKDRQKPSGDNRHDTSVQELWLKIKLAE